MNRRSTICSVALVGGVVFPAILEALNALFELDFTQQVLMFLMALCFIGIGIALSCMARNQGDILANQEEIKAHLRAASKG